MLQPLWRGICQDLVKLKMHVPFNSAILLLDVFPEKSCTSAQRGMYQRAHRGSVCDSEKLDMTYLQENE